MESSASHALKKKLIKAINREELVKIVCDLVNIHSPTGSEKQCADYIIDRFQKADIKLLPQVFDEIRSNAIGLIEGDGSGARLMLNGHIDTSFIGDEEYLPRKPGFQPRAVIDGDWIYGLGVYNMKAAVACFIHAAEILKRENPQLPGDLLIACVAGEIEKSQVDRFQGPLYRGGSCGTWYAINHGAVADFAVVGEPSGLKLVRAHGGYVWTKITLVGDPMHSIYGIEKNNTINNMMKIMQAVQAWGNEYEKRQSKLGMLAHVTLSAIDGGWPYRCSRVPLACSLYVDTRLMPGQQPLEVQREIAAVVKGVQEQDPDLGRLVMDMHIFANQWGSECPPEEFIHQAVAKAHEEALGKKVEVSTISFAGDAAELVMHGIPALYYGPTGRTRSIAKSSHVGEGGADWDPKQGEHVSITDLISGTKVYLTLIVDLLSKTRKEMGLTKPKDTHKQAKGTHKH